MTAKQLKNSILQQAIQGKLINQNKEDEPASELLKRIKAEREKLIKSGKIKINKNISAIYRKGNSFYEKIENEEICIDAELPFEIPKTWEWLRLGELCTIINGFTPLRTNPKFWENPTISWFTVNDIHSQGRRIKYTKQSINKCALSDNSSRILPAGTVLICCTASVGEYAITEIPLTTNQQFNGLIINEYYSKYYSSEFLFKIAPTFKAKLFDIAGKTTFNFISVQKLSNLLLPFPPIEEQKRIVNKLNQLMPLIEEYEEKENKLNELDKKFPERLKKSILKEAFDGKLIKSYNKWRELTFSKCVNIIGVKHKIKRKNYLKDGKYPIIDQSQNFISGYSSNKNILINIKKPVIIFGDHNRYFKFVDFDFIAGADGIKILEPKEFFNEKLFYYFCLSLNIPSKGYSRHYKFLTKIKMRIPPIEEQKRIVEKLDKLINACEELKKILFI